MEEQLNQVDRFKLGKKWFWIGFVVATLNLVGGLVYGLALLAEKEHRQEGLVILGWAIVWFLIGFFFIGPWLIKIGLIPRFQVVPRISIPIQSPR